MQASIDIMMDKNMASSTSRQNRAKGRRELEFASSVFRFAEDGKPEGAYRYTYTYTSGSGSGVKVNGQEELDKMAGEKGKVVFEGNTHNHPRKSSMTPYSFSGPEKEGDPNSDIGAAEYFGKPIYMVAQEGDGILIRRYVPPDSGGKVVTKPGGLPAGEVAEYNFATQKFVPTPEVLKEREESGGKSRANYSLPLTELRSDWIKPIDNPEGE